MTVKTNLPSRHPVYNKQNALKPRNTKTAIALRRYLDLTLSGTRKNLAEHGRGRKEHPLSPYTFDRPDIEKSIQRILQTPYQSKREATAPEWINQINKQVITHSGEAPLFAEKFLSPKKNEQDRPATTAPARPLSGVSTKSAPVIVNGEMYYRPDQAYKYLQASSRPNSAKEDRLTRTFELRQKHRSQSMSAIPSDDTKDELKRKKRLKPRKQNLNKDLLPIPFHKGETPHSFIIGARYNCSHFMDSRSFARLGLYVPRQNPVGSFLKSYKGAGDESEDLSDIYVGNTSVLTGGSNGRVAGSYAPGNMGLKYSMQQKPPHHPNAKLPGNEIKTVVKEAWLKEKIINEENRKPPSGKPRAQSRASSMHQSRKTHSNTPTKQPTPVSDQSARTPSKSNTPNVESEARVADGNEVKTPMQLMQQKRETEEMFNNLHITSSPNTEDKSTNGGSTKQTIEAVLPPIS